MAGIDTQVGLASNGWNRHCIDSHIINCRRVGGSAPPCIRIVHAYGLCSCIIPGNGYCVISGTAASRDGTSYAEY